MDETQAQLAAGAAAARENPGRLMTVYGRADAEHLAKLAAKAQREADRLTAEAATVTTEVPDA